MALRPIDFLRIANPWLVGANVSRVVPVYVLNNLISPDFKKSDYLTHIKHLAFDADLGLQRLMNSFDLNPVSYIDLETTVMGLLAPERRIFRDNSKGGASESGALFPLLGGLTVSSPSDDGLGKRFRKMYDEHTDNLLHTLKDLMAPKENNDPATEFTNRLLAGINGEFNSPPEQTKANGLKGFDLACARFVDNLISSIPKHNRIQGIRRLALGVFFVSIMKMVNGDWLENEPQKRYVFVFGGLPPGSSSEPTVRAASKSFINWIKQSHKSIVLSLYNKLGTFKALPKASESDALRQKVKQAFLKNSFKEPQIDDFLEEISALIKGKELSKDWCKEAVESKAIGFSSAEYARRVRNLSANIGFAGPDKGLLPRLIVDTPLLGVLVKGICGNNSMAYEDLVTKLSNDFGLVLGIGSDDSITEKIGAIGQEGYDPYELLQRNETLLRERLIRTGLARTYSDSHTEVYGDA